MDDGHTKWLSLAYTVSTTTHSHLSRTKITSIQVKISSLPDFAAFAYSLLRCSHAFRFRRPRNPPLPNRNKHKVNWDSNRVPFMVGTCPNGCGMIYFFRNEPDDKIKQNRLVALHSLSPIQTKWVKESQNVPREMTVQTKSVAKLWKESYSSFRVIWKQNAGTDRQKNNFVTEKKEKQITLAQSGGDVVCVPFSVRPIETKTTNRQIIFHNKLLYALRLCIVRCLGVHTLYTYKPIARAQNERKTFQEKFLILISHRQNTTTTTATKRRKWLLWLFTDWNITFSLRSLSLYLLSPSPSTVNCNITNARGTGMNSEHTRTLEHAKEGARIEKKVSSTRWKLLHIFRNNTPDSNIIIYADADDGDVPPAPPAISTEFKCAECATKYGVPKKIKMRIGNMNERKKDGNRSEPTAKWNYGKLIRHDFGSWRRLFELFSFLLFFPGSPLVHTNWHMIDIHNKHSFRWRSNQFPRHRRRRRHLKPKRELGELVVQTRSGQIVAARCRSRYDCCYRWGT